MTFLTQLATTAALLMGYLAYEWSTVGYGLNPGVAVPMVLILLAAPYLLNYLSREE